MRIAIYAFQTKAARMETDKLSHPETWRLFRRALAAKPKRFGKNPFTGEDQWFAAKPASVRVKVRPLKKLKDAPL